YRYTMTMTKLSTESE
ncbi:hypothetical protein VN97_g10176, partial [Penicillium thymicola]